MNQLVDSAPPKAHALDALNALSGWLEANGFGRPRAVPGPYRVAFLGDPAGQASPPLGAGYLKTAFCPLDHWDTLSGLFDLALAMGHSVVPHSDGFGVYAGIAANDDDGPAYESDTVPF